MIDDNLKYYYVTAPIMIIIGGGIAFGGFALYKRGKKNSQLTDTFKF